ncbi:hypothetical protein MTR_6g011090 [Medicago truncatula]|uniref:Uncharacterized protein n=1 Tax=Medicago truncatula TaxID=3880 RepID=A0A072UGN8_MEDTR|nr:hypothetical protein MTR_6g011090 [Medicago truncatula]
MSSVEMCLKIYVEVWENRGTFAGQRGTIGWFRFWVCRWKNRGKIQEERGTMEEERGTMQEIRASIVLLPTPSWHDGHETWHDAAYS